MAESEKSNVNAKTLANDILSLIENDDFDFALVSEKFDGIAAYIETDCRNVKSGDNKSQAEKHLNEDLQLRDAAFAVVEQKLVDLKRTRDLLALLLKKAKCGGDKVSDGIEFEVSLGLSTRPDDSILRSKIAASRFGIKRPSEAIANLSKLLDLVPGAAVADHVRGYGEIVSEDAFYKNFAVKFDNVAGDQTIGFEYATEALEKIDGNNVHAWRHAMGGEEFASLCQKKPDEVVARTLFSYGALNALLLEKRLLSGILPADIREESPAWKLFWTKARAGLGKKNNEYQFADCNDADNWIHVSVKAPPALRKNENFTIEVWRGPKKDEKELGARAGKTESAGEAKASKLAELFDEIKLSEKTINGSPRQIVTCRDPKRILAICCEIGAIVGGKAAKAEAIPENAEAKSADEAAPANALALTDAQFGVISANIAFALKACVADRSFGPETKIRLLMAAHAIGLDQLAASIGATRDTQPVDEFVFVEGTNNAVIDVFGTLASPKIVSAAARKMTAKDIDALIESLDLENRNEVAKKFADALTGMPGALVKAAAGKLMNNSASGLDSVIKNELGKARPSFIVLNWVCGEIGTGDGAKYLERIGLSKFAVVSIALASLENEAGGEDLRMKNEIKKRFVADKAPKGGIKAASAGEKWFVPLMEKMTSDERATVLDRFNRLDGVWDQLDKHNVIALITNRWAELKDTLQKEEVESDVGFFEQNATSARSFRERQAAYDKLMNEEIPQNRRDIEHAKSFGDLSENFEYETARNNERALIARQTKYEEDLRTVHGFDFATVPEQNGFVGMGSYVTIRDDSGAVASYAILGMWDSAPDLGVVSCNTPVARALFDNRVGDTVVLEVGDMKKTATIVSIDPLPAAIVEWAK